MSRSFVVVALLLFACGPSQPKKHAESQAFTAFVDYCLQLAQMRHACDREQEATIDALTAGTQALKADLMRLYLTYTKDYERADAAEKSCRGRLPSLAEQEKEYRKRVDAWTKTCLACASEQKCVEVQRTLRDLDETDMDSFEDQLGRLKRQSVCN